MRIKRFCRFSNMCFEGNQIYIQNLIRRILAAQINRIQPPIKHTVAGQTFWLSPERCIYWEDQNILIVSDLHFGKTGHFRKAGIAVPQLVYKDDMQRLMNQLQIFKPTQLIVVGDLFHSHANKELDLFKRWRYDLDHIQVHLVKGNHDILHDSWYHQCGIEVHQQALSIGNICFLHDMDKHLDLCAPETTYFFTGHLHPGVRISGLGRQSLQFPCFYFTDHYAVLPAFSRFTGLALIDPKEKENVFAIVENALISIK